ncbi:MAG: GNAT family N-acetyltransferase [Akkermansiaceae bacterium]|nr:GNAT family N-acetyltransferase [Verrucomicrobiales bacterium]
MVSEPSASGIDSPLIVQRESPLEQTDWNTRLSSFPGSGIFYTREWAAVLHDSYGFTPVYFCAKEKGRTVGLFPVMEVNSWLTGRRGVSLPFTDHCEPLERLDNSSGPLFQEILKHARSRQWKHWEWRGERGVAREFTNFRPSLSFFTHDLNLQRAPEILFNGFESSVRRALRKAEKSGVTVEVSRELSSVLEFYRLHCQTRKEHGLPPQPLAFFLNIHRHILSQDMGMVISARHENRIVASAMFFHFGTEAIYKFGASDASFQHTRANNLVMWEAIKGYALKGFKRLSFGRTSLNNEGLRRFKLGWGAEESQSRYYKFDFATNDFATDTDGTVGFHTRVFQALPAPWSRLVGSILYRHIA